jgi:4-hydroxy-2-oxoheptanedioate aldolase
MTRINSRRAALCVGLLLWSCAAQAQAPKPKRINRAIELLEQGQPFYYAGSHNGTIGNFEQGKKDAQTWADYISYDMEAAPYDIAGLASYMQGLAAGGPTRTGHKTPTVIVNLPVRGTDEASIRANAWMFEQVLATGVHGILLCHATTAGAVRAMVESVRYPNREQGVGQQGLQEGRRGAHGAPMASQIWGVSQAEYMEKADVWPLNPRGEIMLGLKIEDKFGYEHAGEMLKVPGIAFGEGGPGDMGLSFGFKPNDPRAKEVQDKLFALAKANHIHWLGIGGPPGPNRQAAIEATIKEGHMVGSGEDTAAIGRKFTKRPMPY